MSKPSRIKTCPYCAETILAVAVKCRHCEEILDQDQYRSLRRSIQHKLNDHGDVPDKHQPTASPVAHQKPRVVSLPPSSEKTPVAARPPSPPPLPAASPPPVPAAPLYLAPSLKGNSQRPYKPAQAATSLKDTPPPAPPTPAVRLSHSRRRKLLYASIVTLFFCFVALAVLVATCLPANEIAPSPVPMAEQPAAQQPPHPDNLLPTATPLAEAAEPVVDTAATSGNPEASDKNTIQKLNDSVTQ